MFSRLVSRRLVRTVTFSQQTVVTGTPRGVLCQTPLLRPERLARLTFARTFSDQSQPPQPTCDAKPSLPKTWTLRTCLDDHGSVWLRLPNIMGAYMGPHSIEPKLNESIMVAVNSVNQCPYCEGLHGQVSSASTRTVRLGKWGIHTRIRRF
jgi:hypothetical protein